MTFFKLLPYVIGYLAPEYLYALYITGCLDNEYLYYLYVLAVQLPNICMISIGNIILSWFGLVHAEDRRSSEVLEATVVEFGVFPFFPFLNHEEQR